MKNVRLGQIAADLPCDFGDEPNGNGPTFDVVKVSNVSAEGELYGRFEKRQFRASQIDSLLVREGELLVVKSSGSKANILSGKTAICDKDRAETIVASNFLLRLRVDESVAVPRFVWYVLNSSRSKAFVKTIVGASTYPNLKWSLYSSHPIPLPPVAEQRRIAKILDKADALRAKRRAALTQLDTLTQSIFVDMFGDPATNPKGWPVRRIAEIAECLDRLRRPVTESDRKPGNVPYFGANGRQGWIDTALFDEPLVLVAEDGGYFDTPERGVAYRIDGPAWVNNHAHILRARPDHVETEFLHRALRHFNFLPFISGTTRAKLTQGQLNSVKLFVPPLQLQHRFGDTVAGVQRCARDMTESREQLDALFSSLQYRIFRGDSDSTWQD